MVNTTAAIMALPAPLDPIRLVGDEDKHATLLFLGETSTLPDDAKQVLTDSVQQASSMLFPFSERIRDVTRLGAELPPALVVTLSDMNLSQIRNLFMMNPSIKSYLDNTQQFPAFTPHVTLGHPDFTDEVILRALAKNLFRVQFDRLAVWFNDEKIEFPLAFDNQDNIAMSDAIGEFLEHHGVKGQKWGVRKDQLGVTALVSGSHKGDKGPIKLLKRVDPSKPVSDPSKDDVKNLVKATTQARDGALGKQSLSRITALNKAVMKDLDAKKYEWNKGAQNEYYNHVASHMETGAKAAIKNKDITAWVRPIGQARFILHVGHQDAINAFKKDYNVAHAAMSDVMSVNISATRDDNGLVVGLKADDTPISHVDDFVDNFFEHHGIKGMKWGVRRRPDASTGLVPRHSSADQISQDRILKKVKIGGVEALSNKDIQDYTRRLQLSQDLSKALASQSAAQKAKADGFIKTFVKKQGARQFDRVANKAIDIAIEKAIDSAGGKIGKSNPVLGKDLGELSKRLKPKKK